MPGPVTLSVEEASALKHALDSYLPELEFELARIKLADLRRDLVEEERILRALRDRLS